MFAKKNRQSGCIFEAFLPVSGRPEICCTNRHLSAVQLGRPGDATDAIPDLLFELTLLRCPFCSPAKAPLAASAGGGRGADVTKKDKVTSLPKLASAFDRQALAGKENLKRVAGATLGLDERERKRQQIERNRVRAEGNEARTGERGVRTGAEVSGSGKSGLPLRADGGRTERNGVRTELNGMRTENSEVPSGADGGRTERNSVRTELGGIRTEKSELPPGADGGRTDRNGMRTEPKVTRTVGDGNQTERNGNRTELDGQRTERNDVRTEADGKRTELNGPSDSVAGARDGSHEKRTTEQTERNEKSEDARSPYVPTEEKLQTEDGRGCSEADADRQKTGDQFGEGVRGKLTEEALRAALNTEDAEVPKLRIEKKTGSDGAGTQKREVGSQEVGGNKSEPRKEAGTGDPGKRGTVLNESKPDGKLGAVDVNGKEKEQGSQGNRVQTAAEKERGTKRGFSEELRRVVPDDLRPKETGERETLTQRKHRIAERVLRKQDRNVESLGRTSGDRPRADAPAASKRTSDDLDRTGGASEKRAKPDTAEQSAKRPKVISGSEKEGIEAMRRMNQGGVDVRVQDGGIRERHVAAGERGETATKRDTSGEKTGWTTGGDKGKVEGRKVGDAGIPGFQRSRDDVSKVAGPAAAGGKRVGAGEERRKDTGGSRTAVNEKPRGGSRRPAENAEMRPRVQERTAATAPGDGDRAKMKRRIFEELSELSVREREVSALPRRNRSVKPNNARLYYKTEGW